MTLAEPELRQRRGQGRPHVWGPLWSLACGVISAAPPFSPLLLARLTAAVFVTGTIWTRLWPAQRADEQPEAAARTPLRPLAIQLWLLLALVLLINARAASWLVVAAFLVAASAVLVRRMPGVHLVVDLMGSIARIAMPGWLGWLAASADRQPLPEPSIAWAPWPGLWSALGLYALPLAVWACFTVVDFSFTAHGRGRGEPLWRGPLLLAAYVVLALVLADQGQAVAAAAITMFGATQLPMLGALDHGRRRWYAQAAQPVSILALLAAAVAIARHGP